MPSQKRTERVANRLLSALPAKEYQRLLPELEEVDLIFADVLCKPGERIRYVYFPNDSIISLLAAVGEHSTLEVGIVGSEGMVGIGIFMGVDVSRNQALVQGAGTAMRMKAAAFRRESQESDSLQRLLLRYSHSLLTQVSQSAACNRFHTVNARLARWLLMTHERLKVDEFRLTQEFMSNMLGVRREGVNHAAGALQQAGLISYSRGIIRVHDRVRLEAVSCECYQIIKEESDGYLNKN